MNPVLVPANITSPQDMLIILVVALIVFGPKKLPEIGRQLGSALREFNKIRTDAMSAFHFDELTHYDSTPSYHTPPYGTTYPTNSDPFTAVDSYHSGATETVYHDDPLHTAPALESATTFTGGEHAVLPDATAKVVTAPPGPAALREIIATHAELASSVLPTDPAHDVTMTHSVEAHPLSGEKTIQ